jgi:hypothetical protein
MGYTVIGNSCHTTKGMIKVEKFFYLDSTNYSKRQGIRIPTLKKDLIRGVKNLSEIAYSKHWGSTRGSLRFFNILTKHIDVTKIHRAIMKYSHKHHYTLFLHSVEGYRIVLKGVSGGYSGEGTRGCHDVLTACGFNAEQCKKAFTKETFEVRKA